MLLTRLTLSIVLLALGAEAAADTYAFIDVNVVPMDTERVLERQVVVVEDGVITAVGPNTEVQVPGDAVLIDGVDRYLMPGLADMHTHTFSEDELTLFIANGVTTIRNMWGAPMHLDWQKRIEAGELTGPTIHTAGALIDGDPPIWPGCTVVTTAEEARTTVRRQADEGYQFIKVYNRLKPDVYQAIIETAREVDIPVIGHVPNAVGLHDALASGQHCIEHLVGYIDACKLDDAPDADESPLNQRAVLFFDEAKLAETVQATLDAGTWNCVTLVVLQKWVPQEEAEKFLERPEMRYLPAQTRASWNPSTDFRTKNLDAERYALLRKGDEVRKRITLALHEAGAPLLLGTDTPNPFVVPGFSIHEELANLVDAGLSPYRALRTGTAAPAEYLGTPEAFGTVAEGRRADLVLLTSNPLEDVANVAERAGVMVRGRWLPESELQEQLETLALSYESTEDIEADEDFFAGFDPLPEAGEAEFTGRYSIGFGDAVGGFERFTVRRLEDGSRLIVGQSRTLPPYESTITSRLEINPDGTRQVLALDVKSSMGTYQVSATREGTQLDVEVTDPSGTTKSSTEIGAGDSLEAQVIATGVLLNERMAAIEPGGSHRVKAHTMLLFPGYRLESYEFDIQRGDDAPYETAAGPVTARVYTYTYAMWGMDNKVTVYLDEAGHLLESTIEQPMGKMVLKRVE